MLHHSFRLYCSLWLWHTVLIWLRGWKARFFFFFFFSFPWITWSIHVLFCARRSMSRSAVKQRHRLWPTMMGVSEGGQWKVLRRSGSGLFVGSERGTRSSRVHKTQDDFFFFTQTVPTATQPITACYYVCGESAPLCSQWETHSAKSSRRRRPAEVFQQASSKTPLHFYGVEWGHWQVGEHFESRSAVGLYTTALCSICIYVCLSSQGVGMIILMLQKNAKGYSDRIKAENNKKQIETLLLQNDEINLVNVFHSRSD